jgi:hypothetical protein
MVLLVVSQIRETLGEDPVGKKYQTTVRLHLCSTSMWADDDIERNITSSDVEFLEGKDSNKKSNAKTLGKVKDKPESEPFNNAGHVLTTPDLTGLIHDDDVDMSDIMSVTSLASDN